MRKYICRPGLFVFAFACLSLLLAPAAPAGDGKACEGDVDGNGVVDVFDIIGVLQDWGACDDTCAGDLNGDGIVDIHDLLIVILNFGCGAQPCETHADCDDGDPCTFDVCILGGCHHFTLPNCP
ncbi:MAG: hypothetical protein L0Y44_12655 [Phycisphaerales bacterium]|nr:hypothetical protein [Phycisphaerales bacterium]MCI0631493.1 hypothetical protein [Phycisphaerales bacterium]MCI0677134.1 hypothetical protein [Phycisphaerales bacterium]